MGPNVKKTKNSNESEGDTNVFLKEVISLTSVYSQSKENKFTQTCLSGTQCSINPPNVRPLLSFSQISNLSYIIDSSQTAFIFHQLIMRDLYCNVRSRDWEEITVCFNEAFMTQYNRQLIRHHAMRVMLPQFIRDLHTVNFSFSSQSSLYCYLSIYYTGVLLHSAIKEGAFHVLDASTTLFPAPVYEFHLETGHSPSTRTDVGFENNSLTSTRAISPFSQRLEHVSHPHPYSSTPSGQTYSSSSPSTVNTLGDLSVWGGLYESGLANSSSVDSDGYDEVHKRLAFKKERYNEADLWSMAENKRLELRTGGVLSHLDESKMESDSTNTKRKTKSPKQKSKSSSTTSTTIKDTAKNPHPGHALNGSIELNAGRTFMDQGVVDDYVPYCLLNTFSLQHFRSNSDRYGALTPLLCRWTQMMDMALPELILELHNSHWSSVPASVSYYDASVNSHSISPLPTGMGQAQGSILQLYERPVYKDRLAGLKITDVSQSKKPFSTDELSNRTFMVLERSNASFIAGDSSHPPLTYSDNPSNTAFAYSSADRAAKNTLLPTPIPLPPNCPHPYYHLSFSPRATPVEREVLFCLQQRLAVFFVRHALRRLLILLDNPQGNCLSVGGSSLLNMAELYSLALSQRSPNTAAAAVTLYRKPYVEDVSHPFFKATVTLPTNILSKLNDLCAVTAIPSFKTLAPFLLPSYDFFSNSRRVSAWIANNLSSHSYPLVVSNPATLQYGVVLYSHIFRCFSSYHHASNDSDGESDEIDDDDESNIHHLMMAMGHMHGRHMHRHGHRGGRGGRRGRGGSRVECSIM